VKNKEYLVTGGMAPDNHCCELGEGLFVSGDMVVWLGIAADQVYIRQRGMVKRFDLPVKATVILDCLDDTPIVASDKGLGAIAVSAGKYHLLQDYASVFCSDTHRTNDGCKLSSGRFLVGTMHKMSPNGVPGAVFFLDGSGTAHKVISGIHIPNSFIEIAKDVVLITDSYLGIIYKCTFDAHTLLARTKWYEAEESESPDGGCILPDDRIAIAVWDAACIRIFDHLGSQIFDLPVSAKRPTNTKYDRKIMYFG